MVTSVSRVLCFSKLSQNKVFPFACTEVKVKLTKSYLRTSINKGYKYLHKQLAVRDATMVFKCLNGLAPPYLCQKFKTRSEVHNCNTRNRDRLHIPLCRTAAGQRAFTFRGQRLWNSLPDEFQSITNLDVFKVKIKQHFLRVFLEN